MRALLGTGTLETGTLVVGAGPAGMAPLVAASRDGTLAALLSHGLVIAEQGPAVGSGGIGGYLINSDSSAETFLSAVDGNPLPQLAALSHHPVAHAVRAHGAGAVPLSLVGAFLGLVGEAIASVVRDSPAGRVLCGHRAAFTRRLPDGRWLTRLQPAGGGEATDVVSRAVLMATGGHQPEERLAREPVAGRPLLPACGRTLMQSDRLLTAEGAAEAVLRLAAAPHPPRVAVVGGSTSALSCVRVLLSLPGAALGAGAVTLMHRHALPVFYRSVALAWAGGYDAFGPGDVCPVSGFVFRFAGLRLDSRDLLMQALGIGGAAPEPRLRLHRLDGQDPAGAQAVLDRADLVVSCLGYRPRALAVQDVAGRPVRLRAEADGGALINAQCGVIDEAGAEIEGLFGIGLAAGFRPGPAMGGEPSFTGQVNGLWLWQNDVGRLIARRMLEAARLDGMWRAPFLAAARAPDDARMPFLHASEVFQAVA